MNSQVIKEASERYNRMLSDPQEKLEPDHKNLMDIFEQTWRAVANLEHKVDQLQRQIDDLESPAMVG